MLELHGLKREQLKDFIAKKGDALVGKVLMSRRIPTYQRCEMESKIANMLSEVGFAADYTETGSKKTKK